jgi:uncharacterized protein (DUF433 family)
MGVIAVLLILRTAGVVHRTARDVGAPQYHGCVIDWSSSPVVERDPERVSGAWVFRGTRVPVAALFENLEDGAQVAEFVAWFPGVTLEQVRAVLEHAARSTLTPA